MPYIEKKIYSGDLLEVERCHVAPNGRTTPKTANENESKRGQEDLNNRNAQKKLMRLLNTNFNGKAGDQFVTLTYAKPVDEATAKREVINFFRRVKYYRKGRGLPEAKYITITENQGQWHHHVIMNNLPVETIAKLWGRGRVTVSILDKTYNFEDLTRYLVKTEKPSKSHSEIENTKEKRKKHARRWNSSQNLQQPTVETKEIKHSDVKAEPKAPKGYYLLPNWVSGCDIQGNLYQYFKCVKLDEKPRRGKKQRRSKAA